MFTLAQMRDIHRAPESGAADTPQPSIDHRYLAFLSYSHEDQATADWLHRMLENFSVPPTLVGRHTAAGRVPNRLAPIFRDRQELPAAADLGSEIRLALASSRALIVLCSPAAAKSRWANAEIDAFKRVRRDGYVLAAIVDGEPFASNIPGQEQNECFPPALRQKYDRRGRPTQKRAEPIAADLRDSRDGKRIGFLKLVAGLLGIGLDELVQRETRRRQSRLALLTAASLGGIVVTSTLAIAAIEARQGAIQARDEALDQRREAEGLTKFMLDDRQAVAAERPAALESVARRALAYNENQDPTELSDESLLQRSRAITLLGRAATKRGEFEAADRFYKQALAGTAEAVRRNRNDPRRILHHSQTVYWKSELAQRRGDLPGFEASIREYQHQIERLVELEPRNLKWRRELYYASFHLGIMLYEQRRFGDAATQFQQSIRTAEAKVAADSKNLMHQADLANSLGWLAAAAQSQGYLKSAASFRERQVELLMTRCRGHEEYKLRLTEALVGLARISSVTGRRELASRHFRTAVATADNFVPVDNVSVWYRSAVNARLAYAGFLLDTGEEKQASAQTKTACDIADSLAAQTGNLAWRTIMAECWVLRGRLALSVGRRDEAASSAQRAVDVAKSVNSGSRFARGFALARALHLFGEVRYKFGDKTAAHAAWIRALDALPPLAGGTPSEMDERARILLRLGRSTEAENIQAKLDSIGYRRVA